MADIKMMIANGSQKIILPVPPDSYEVTDHWDNQELNINQLGLITMIGKRGLRSITISSFLPMKNYDFSIRIRGGTVFDNFGSAAQVMASDKRMRNGNLDPWGVIRVLQSWRGKVLTFSISATAGRVSWPCVIDGDFTYSEKDASGDVYYTITLKEYKRTNTKRTVKTPKKSGAKTDQITTKNHYEIGTYKTKKNDTLSKISRSITGESKQAKTLYNQNKKAVDKAIKKYRKKLSKKKRKQYDKKAIINKPLPNGVKLTYGLGWEEVDKKITSKSSGFNWK